MDNKLKEYQKKQEELNGKLALLFLITFFLLITLFIILSGLSSVVKIISSIILIPAIIIVAYNIVRIYKRERIIDKDILKLINSYLKENKNSEFIEKDFLYADQFYESDFLNKINGNTFKCTDTLVGPNFSSSFVNVYYIRRSGKHSTKITLFNGRFYIIDINANIEGKIIIKEEHDFLNTVPKGFTEVEFESIDFGKKFNVYCNLEEEAFRKIKPQQILEIMKLEEFKDGTLFITISSSKLYIGYFSGDKVYSKKDFTDTRSIDTIVDNEIDLVNEFLKLHLN